MFGIFGTWKASLSGLGLFKNPVILNLGCILESLEAGYLLLFTSVNG